MHLMPVRPPLTARRVRIETETRKEINSQGLKEAARSQESLLLSPLKNRKERRDIRTDLRLKSLKYLKLNLKQEQCS